MTTALLPSRESTADSIRSVQISNPERASRLQRTLNRKIELVSYGSDSELSEQTTSKKPENLSSSLVRTNSLDWGILLRNFNNQQGASLNKVALDLEEALADLDEIKEEAWEKEFPEPTDMAVSGAESLLKRLYEVLPCRFEVYPMPSGEIALDVPSGYKQSIVFLCQADGSVVCMVYLNGIHKNTIYPTVQALPDQFVRDTLLQLQ